MNSVNFLEKLLDGAGVEWRPLGKIANKISSGGTPKTDVAEYYHLLLNLQILSFHSALLTIPGTLSTD